MTDDRPGRQVCSAYNLGRKFAARCEKKREPRACFSLRRKEREHETGCDVAVQQQQLSRSAFQAAAAAAERSSAARSDVSIYRCVSRECVCVCVFDSRGLDGGGGGAAVGVGGPGDGYDVHTHTVYNTMDLDDSISRWGWNRLQIYYSSRYI